MKVRFQFTQFLFNHSSSGVIIVSQDLPIREAAYLPLLIWEASEAEEYVNTISRLPRPTT
jgi:hypothetical protein